MAFPKGQKKKRDNRAELRTLGHSTTESAVAEITRKIPTFNMTTGYPKVNGAHPSLATLVLFARNTVDLTFDGPDWRPPVSRHSCNATRRSHNDRGGDFTVRGNVRSSFSNAWSFGQ